jgi:hypothetical protein
VPSPAKRQLPAHGILRRLPGASHLKYVALNRGNKKKDKTLPTRSPRNFTPIRQIQMARFDGKSWVLFGDVLGGK